MSDLSYSAMLRNLAADYYYQRLSRDDYRAQRRQLLQKIDEEFNGQKNFNMEDEAEPALQDDDADQSIFMKTIAFFKNRDLDD